MEPSLSDLILFNDEETSLFNDPLFSSDAVSQYQEKKEKYDRKEKVNTFWPRLRSKLMSHLS